MDATARSELRARITDLTAELAKTLQTYIERPSDELDQWHLICATLNSWSLHPHSQTGRLLPSLSADQQLTFLRMISSELTSSTIAAKSAMSRVQEVFDAEEEVWVLRRAVVKMEAKLQRLEMKKKPPKR